MVVHCEESEEEHGGILRMSPQEVPFRCPQRSLSFGEVFFGESLPYVQSRVTSLELRCPIRTAFLDISGSMCTSYSTLGNLEKAESENSILLVIWMTFNFERRTPLIVHENVQGFVSELICEEAKKQGYECITLRAKPSDLGLPVNRYRKPLGGNCSKQMSICLLEGCRARWELAEFGAPPFLGLNMKVCKTTFQPSKKKE